MTEREKWALIHSKAKELRTLAQNLGLGAVIDGKLTGVVIEANQRRRTAEEAEGRGSRIPGVLANVGFYGDAPIKLDYPDALR